MPFLPAIRNFIPSFFLLIAYSLQLFLHKKDLSCKEKLKIILVIVQTNFEFSERSFMNDEKNILGLHLPTDPRWVNLAQISLEDILTDHAYCEQKAATSCIS